MEYIPVLNRWTLSYMYVHTPYLHVPCGEDRHSLGLHPLSTPAQLPQTAKPVAQTESGRDDFDLIFVSTNRRSSLYYITWTHRNPEQVLLGHNINFRDVIRRAVIEEKNNHIIGHSSRLI